jgi:hypothetical protein
VTIILYTGVDTLQASPFEFAIPPWKEVQAFRSVSNPAEELPDAVPIKTIVFPKVVLAAGTIVAVT